MSILSELIRKARIARLRRKAYKAYEHYLSLRSNINAGDALAFFISMDLRNRAKKFDRIMEKLKKLGDPGADKVPRLYKEE